MILSHSVDKVGCDPGGTQPGSGTGSIPGPGRYPAGRAAVPPGVTDESTESAEPPAAGGPSRDSPGPAGGTCSASVNFSGKFSRLSDHARIGSRTQWAPVGPGRPARMTTDDPPSVYRRTAAPGSSTSLTLCVGVRRMIMGRSADPRPPTRQGPALPACPGYPAL
eukprot:760647-Hanusia_phi.AAC.1